MVSCLPIIYGKRDAGLLKVTHQWAVPNRRLKMFSLKPRFFQLWLTYEYVYFTDCVSGKGNVIGCVRPSVGLRLFRLLSFEPTEL